MERHVQIWNECLGVISEITSPQSFRTWFEPIVPVSFKDNVLTIQVPSPFFYEWLEEHYVDMLKRTINRVIGREGRLEYHIIVENDANPQVTILPSKHKNETINPMMSGQDIKNPFIIPGLKRMQIESQLNQNYSFDNFIEGECNQLARAAAMQIAENPGKTAFNPFFIYSATGLGKSHLCHAIGLQVKHKYPNKNVLYLQTEQFTQQYVSALKNHTLNDLVHFYQLIDVLIIDDIQFIAGKPAMQDTFFQIFNFLHQSGKQLVLTSDKAPVDLQDVEPRLLSRFKWGLTTELTLPDLETRVGILRQKLYDDGVVLDDEIVNYLANNVKTNVREMEGVLISLLAQSSFNKKEITIDLARQIIDKFIRNTVREVSIDYIINVVCDKLNVGIDKFSEKTRKREIVQARQLAMYFSKKYTKTSLTIIGQMCGDKDHATVLHACKTVENLMETDKKFKKLASEIEKKISF